MEKPSQRTLSKDELLKIRSRLEPPRHSNEEAQRLERKYLSDERVKLWPNTLEATRLKKQNWKIEKERKLEEERLEIDREEAEYKRKVRIETITKATEALYEQTHRMKELRSGQLYQEVLETQKAQLGERAARKSKELNRDKIYMSEILNNMKVQVEREEKECKLVKQARKAIAAAQLEQLQKARENLIDSMQQELEYGKELFKKAAEEVIIEEKNAIQARVHARSEANKMMEINDQLQELKQQERLQEIEENKCFEAERNEMEATAERRKVEARNKFEAKMKIRQATLDRATAHLVQCTNNIDAKKEHERKVLIEKEDAIAQNRINMRIQEHKAIEKSRKMFYERQEAKKELDKLHARSIREHYKSRAEEAMLQNKLEEEEVKRRNYDVRNSQVRQIYEAQDRRQREEAMESQRHAQMLDMEKEQSIKFVNVAKDVLNKLEVEGRNTFIVRRMLNDHNEKLSNDTAALQ